MLDLDELVFDPPELLFPSPPLLGYTNLESPEQPAIPPRGTFEHIATSSLVAQMPLSPGRFACTSADYPGFTAVDIAPKTPAQLLVGLGFRQFEKQLLEATGMRPF